MKYIKKIRLSGFGYNINRIVNNYIMLPIARIFSNIKYILTHELVNLDMLDVVDDRLHHIEDKTSTLLNDVDNLECDINEKCDEYQVEDVIYNQFGSVEDFITYDDLCEVKDDIKDINKKLNTIIDEDLKVIYDKLIRFNTIKDDVSIEINNDDEGLKTSNFNNFDDIKNVDNLLQEVNTLHSLFNQLTQDFAKLSKNNVDDVIKSIANKLRNKDEYGELEKRLEGVLESVNKEIKLSKSLNKRLIGKLNNV